MTGAARIGTAAVAAKGWYAAHKWLVARRFAQIGFMALFAAGPWLGLKIVKGTIASSLTLGVLPLTDPYLLLQSTVAGHPLETAALVGAMIVVLAYALIGGRMYCSWVCPVNIITDAANWLHRRLGLPKGWQPRRQTRLWLLGMTLVVSAISGVVAWELVNPVTLIYRGVLFGGGIVWAVAAGVFLFDLVVGRRAWCGALCPVGAFYGLVGTSSLLKVSAPGRARCNDCMDCFAVCPEPHVLTPALKGELTKSAEDDAWTACGAISGSPVILSRDCTNCGRCIDVCALDVFHFTHRYDFSEDAGHFPAETEPRRAA